MTIQPKPHLHRLAFIGLALLITLILGSVGLVHALTSTFPSENDISVPVRESDAVGFFAQITSPGDVPLYKTKVTAYGQTDNTDAQVGDNNVGGVWASAEFSLDSGKFVLSADFTPLNANTMMIVILDGNTVVNTMTGVPSTIEVVATSGSGSVLPPNVAMSAVRDDLCDQFHWDCPNGMPQTGFAHNIMIAFPETYTFQTQAPSRGGGSVSGDKVAFVAIDKGVQTGDLTGFKLASTTPLKLASYNVSTTNAADAVSTKLRYDFSSREQTVGFAADLGLTVPLTQALAGGSFTVQSYGSVDGISVQPLAGVDGTYNDAFDRLSLLPAIGERLNPYPEVGIVVLHDGVPVGGDEPHTRSPRNASENLRAHGYSGWLTCIYFVEPLELMELVTVPRFATQVNPTSFGTGFSIDSSAFGLPNLHNLDPVSLKFDREVSFELTHPDAPSDFVEGDQIIFFPFSKVAPEHDQITGVGLDADGLDMRLSDPVFTDSEPTSYYQYKLEAFNASLGRVNGLLTLLPVNASNPAGFEIETGKADSVSAEIKPLASAPNGSQIKIQARNNSDLLSGILLQKNSSGFQALPELDSNARRPAFIKLDGFKAEQPVVSQQVSDLAQLPQVVLPSVDGAVMTPYVLASGELAQVIRWEESVDFMFGGTIYNVDTITWTSDAPLTELPVTSARFVIANGGGLGLADFVLGSAEFKAFPVKPDDNTRVVSDAALSFAPLKPAEFFKVSIELGDETDYASVKLFGQPADVSVTVPVTQAFKLGSYGVGAFNAAGELLNRVVFEPNDANTWLKIANSDGGVWDEIEEITMKLPNGSTVTVPVTQAIRIQQSQVETVDVTPFRYDSGENKGKIHVTVPVTQAFGVQVGDAADFGRSTVQEYDVVELTYVMSLAARSDTAVASLEISGQDLAEINVLDLTETASIPTSVSLGSAGAIRHSNLPILLLVTLVIGSTAAYWNRR